MFKNSLKKLIFWLLNHLFFYQCLIFNIKPKTIFNFFLRFKIPKIYQVMYTWPHQWIYLSPFYNLRLSLIHHTIQYKQKAMMISTPFVFLMLYFIFAFFWRHNRYISFFYTHILSSQKDMFTTCCSNNLYEIKRDTYMQKSACVRLVWSYVNQSSPPVNVLIIISINTHTHTHTCYIASIKKQLFFSFIIIPFFL